MTDPKLLASPKRTANIAGLLYLVIALFGGFSMGYLPSLIFVPGDAATTAQNVLTNLPMFQFGLFADIIVLLSEVALTAILYILFKPVSQTLTMVAAMARLSMVMVMAINIIFKLLLLLVLSGSTYLAAFDTAQLQALAMLLVEAHQYGVYVWGLFFGLHMVILGYLIAKSTYFPKILGILMFVGGFGYAAESLKTFFLPDFQLFSLLVAGLLVIVVLGELSFTLWLLIKGLDTDKWAAKA